MPSRCSPWQMAQWFAYASAPGLAGAGAARLARLRSQSPHKWQARPERQITRLSLPEALHFEISSSVSNTLILVELIALPGASPCWHYPEYLINCMNP